MTARAGNAPARTIKAQTPHRASARGNGPEEQENAEVLNMVRLVRKIMELNNCRHKGTTCVTTSCDYLLAAGIIDCWDAILARWP